MAVNATAVWRVRPSGSNTNGGGYDPGISGAATDYSQQNTAQATGTLGTASGTTTFTDAGGAFTSAMIGNALWIASGAGFTVGAYFITAFGSSTSVTLDRSPGTGTVAHWAVGGGWADFVTNTVNGSSPVVQGNIVYVLGSGTPNPSSYVFDYTVTSAFSFQQGGTGTDGVVILANDPLTPGYVAPPGMGGMPCIKVNTVASNFMTLGYNNVLGFWFVASSMNAATAITLDAGNALPILLEGCVFDQNGNDVYALQSTGGARGNFVLGSEVFSSSGGTGGSAYAIDIQGAPGSVIGCNLHDCVGGGVELNVGVVTGTIIAKNSGIGINITSLSGLIINNTIDGNTGTGIFLNTAGGSITSAILNNIISNHTGAGKFGIDPQIAPPWAIMLEDYNVFYNNTSDISGSRPYGPHDTHGGSNPYVGQSTENYSLA